MAAALARIDSRRFARRSRAMSLVGAGDVVGSEGAESVSGAEAVADEGDAAGELAGECAGSVDSSMGSVDRLGAWGSSG